MLFKFEICFNSTPESPISQYITEQSLKDAIRKVDRTLLRYKGKKVAHIISAEEVPYSDIVSVANYFSSVSSYTASSSVSSYTASSITPISTAYYSANTATAAITANYINYYVSSASTLETGYYNTNTVTI